MESFRLKFVENPTEEQLQARKQLESLFTIGPIICYLRLRLSSSDNIACHKDLNIECNSCPIMNFFGKEDVVNAKHKLISTRERYGAVMVSK